MNRKKAFTLIELLIVVAIIGILAAIAVPNFLNARIKAKLARVEADLRSISLSLESYRLDNGRYIFRTGNMTWPRRWVPLTTPMAYMSGDVFRDPFFPKDMLSNDGDEPIYWYELWRNEADWQVKFNNSPEIYYRDWQNRYKYAIGSAGPDYDIQADNPAVGYGFGRQECGHTYFLQYSTSNGLISCGDIIRFGP